MVACKSQSHHSIRQAEKKAGDAVKAKQARKAALPIASKPVPAAQTSFENDAVVPDAHGLTEQQKRDIRALLVEYDRNRATFDNEDDDGGTAERNRALSSEIQAVEGDIAVMRANIERMFLENPLPDFYMPPAAIAAIAAAIAAADAFDRTIEKYGSLANFHDHIAKTYFNRSKSTE